MAGKRKWKRRKHQQNHSLHSVETDNDPLIEKEVLDLFSKKFQYSTSKDNGWLLPAADQMYSTQPWVDDELQGLKTSLNTIKSQLSDKDISKWHTHTQNMNRAGGVIDHVKHLARPELCTQAWCKFYEIAATYPIVPLDRKYVRFSSFHLCEAPGAFITSLNHYLHLNNYADNWFWLANTLNPYYEGNSHDSMIDDDRFIYNTLPQWCFGKDNTGNVMQADNLGDLIEITNNHGKFDLITADGSIDCANNPAEQESFTTSLHLAEIVTALHILAVGGSVVMKMFTMLEHAAVCTLYLFNCVFQQVNVFKPATSKSGNSEVYVVAIGYQGVDEAVLQKLKQILAPFTRSSSAMFSRDQIPESFLSQHRQCCAQFYQYQRQTIEDNMRCYGNEDAIQHIAAVKEACMHEYISRYRLRAVRNECRIVPRTSGSDHKKRTCAQLSQPSVAHGGYRHRGTYTHRQHLLHLTWLEKVNAFKEFTVEEKVGWLKGQTSLDLSDICQWQPTIGKIPTVINNSKFCDLSALQVYNEILIENSKCCQPVTVADIPTHLQAIINEMLAEGTSLAAGTGCVSQYCKQHIQPSMNTNAATLHCLDTLPELLVEREYILNQGQWPDLNSLLKTLSVGDSAVVSMPLPLTRFMAGLVFLMHVSFENITLVSHPSWFIVYLVAKNFQSNNTSIISSHLQTLEINRTDTVHVIESLPIHLLYDTNFYDFLCKANNYGLKSRINWLMAAEQTENNQRTILSSS